MVSIHFIVMYISVCLYVFVFVCTDTKYQGEVDPQELLCRRFMSREPLSPSLLHAFFITCSFLNYLAFSLPSKLLCAACWHGISQPCTQSPLVLSVLELEHVRVCVPSCVCVPRARVCIHVCIHENIGHTFCSFTYPAAPSSHVTLYVIPQSP